MKNDLEDEPTVASEVAGLRRELKITWAAHEKEHTTHELAHAREHDFAQKAIDVSALQAKENKADANEWRATMNDRERTFATKVDIASISDKISTLQNTEIKRAETERLRLIDEAEDKREQERRDTEEKRDMERRQARGQWTVGIVVGIIASFSAILINVILRLSSGN